MTTAMDKIRLASLKNNFRDRENVQAGMRQFLSEKKDADKLKNLLRDHQEKEVKLIKEMEFRDNMDYLIGYYGILAAAMISGYVSTRLTPAIFVEGTQILSDEAVKQYYQEHYPLILPQVLWAYFENTENTTLLSKAASEQLPEKTTIFENFLQLLRSRMEDEDIDRFLYMLDDGWFYDDDLDTDVSIEDVWRILAEAEKLPARKSKKSRSELLQSALLGFAKYMSYLGQYAAILQSLDDTPYFQSALWHLDAYWFDRIREKLSDVLKTGLETLDNINQKDVYLKFGIDLDESTAARWREESASSTQKAYADIAYLMNIKHGRPVRQLLKAIKSHRQQ